MQTKKEIKTILKIIFVSILVVTLLNNVSGAVLSISNAEIKSNYFDFNKAWVINFIADDYSTDSLTAYLSPQKLEEEAGVETSQSLDISAIVKPTYCTWSLGQDNSNDPDIYLYNPVTESFWFWEEEEAQQFRDNCASFDGTRAIVSESFGEYHTRIWCLREQEKLATLGRFVTTIKTADTEWTVTASGESPEQATIGNGDVINGRSSKIGNNVWVKWLGQADTGEDCPETQDARPIHSNNFQDGWKIGYQGNYENYKSEVGLGNIEALLLQWANGQRTESQLNALLDNMALSAILPNTNFGSFSVIQEDINNGKIKKDLARIIVFPQFQLIVDADYLVINIPTGEPEIISVDDVIFNEGSFGIAIVKIKNKGDYEGGFTTRIISCSEEFSSNTPPQGSTLVAGEEKTLTFEIIGSSTSGESEVNGHCTAEMKEGTTGETVTEQFDISMSQIRECPPPSIACGVSVGRQVIKQCNSEGTGLEIKQICAEDELCKETFSGVKCIKKEQNGEKTNWFSNMLNWFSNINIFGGIFDFLTTIKYIIIVLATVVTLFVTEDILKRIRGTLKRKKALRWGIAIFVGLGVGFALYQFLGSLTFWLIVIGWLIYLIFGKRLFGVFRK